MCLVTVTSHRSAWNFKKMQQLTEERSWLVLHLRGETTERDWVKKHSFHSFRCEVDKCGPERWNVSKPISYFSNINFAILGKRIDFMGIFQWKKKKGTNTTVHSDDHGKTAFVYILPSCSECTECSNWWTFTKALLTFVGTANHWQPPLQLQVGKEMLLVCSLSKISAAKTRFARKTPFKSLKRSNLQVASLAL